MMKIGLIDVDGCGTRKEHPFPNLALMKLSAWHKARGDKVEFVSIGHYDIIYMSKVFGYKPDIQQGLWSADKIIKGGTGYNITETLPDEIEHVLPDYDLYNCQHAYGFLTRGCIRYCHWCVVPKKEGIKNQ